tara:strand:- start:578 stop:784 length:207 start_codon:yes stop_codon:yes gene_type:complete
MFKEYMTSGELNPEVQATMKAATDIANGVLSLREASKLYNIDQDQIVKFIAESSEYDMHVKRRDENGK